MQGFWKPTLTRTTTCFIFLHKQNRDGDFPRDKHIYLRAGTRANVENQKYHFRWSNVKKKQAKRTPKTHHCKQQQQRKKNQLHYWTNNRTVTHELYKTSCSFRNRHALWLQLSIWTRAFSCIQIHFQKCIYHLKTKKRSSYSVWWILWIWICFSNYILFHMKCILSIL